MKKVMKIYMPLAAAVLILFSFNVITASGIKGTVSPAEGAGTVWAINGTDSLKTEPANGAFTLEAKEGTYKIIVEGKAPYKNFEKEGVEVKDGETVDLGEITLQQ